jgi:hypothetical protein
MWREPAGFADEVCWVYDTGEEFLVFFQTDALGLFPLGEGVVENV